MQGRTPTAFEIGNIGYRLFITAASAISLRVSDTAERKVSSERGFLVPSFYFIEKFKKDTKFTTQGGGVCPPAGIAVIDVRGIRVCRSLKHQK
jgi:hypothetical protein